MHIAVRARRLLARRPWIYWCACVVLAFGTAAIVRQQLLELDEARQRWGTTRDVLVATVDHEPGQQLQFEHVAVPLALVPANAVSDMDGGAVTRQRIAAGEIIVDRDTSAPIGPAALADSGTLVVGVSDPLARDVAVGLDVQVSADGVVLAERGRIVDRADDIVFVAVDASAAPMVALAAHDGKVSLLFVP